MALNEELWLPHLKENFFPDDSFVTKSEDHSQYVTYRKVHVPNAGKPSKVVKNRKSLPDGFAKRQDQDLEYEMDELTSDPIYVDNMEEVELSYDKRESILRNDRAELQRKSHMNILHRWAEGVGEEGLVVETSGEAVSPHTSTTATGKRKKIKRSDILKLMTEFNKQDIPQEGRYLLLDSDMYSQLLEDMTEADKYSFHSLADASKGVLGKLYSFHIMERSSTLRVKATENTIINEDDEHEATERAAGFAWHQNCVCRALGEVRFFSRENDPILYGSGYSLLARSGGSHSRYDKKGIALLVQATA